MKRIYTLIAIVVIVLVLFFGGLAVLLANPSYYQPMLVSTFQKETGFELEIKGDMQWRYWPPVALAITDVNVRLPGATTPLASVKHAAVGLRLWPLIMGKGVAVDDITVDGMTVNALVNKSGKANWQPASTTAMPAKPATTPSTTPSGEPTTAQPGSGLDLEIRKIDITDSTLNYQDATAGTNYVVTIPLLRVGAVGYGKPVPVDLSVQVQDKTGGMHVDLDAKGNMTFDRGFKHIGFSKMDVHPLLKMPGLKDIDTNLTLDGSYDVSAGKFTSNVDGTINSSSIKGTLGATLGKILGVKFDLTADQIKAADFLPATSANSSTDDATKSESTTPSASPADISVLPLGLLNSLNFQGTVKIGKLSYDTWTFSDAILNVDNQNKALKADISINGYDGTAKVAFVGSSAGQGAGQTTVNVTGIDLTKFAGFKSITGKITLNSSTKFTGHMLSSILDSLAGTTTFDVTDGTLDVTPIKKIAVLVDKLRSKEPSGIAAWPDQMPFTDMKGTQRFVEGTQSGQQLSVVLDNMTLTGSGGFDYFKNHLAYDIAISLKESDTGRFKVSSGVAAIKWPLRCEGTFDDSPADMCRPDKSGIEKLIGSAIKQKVEDKLKEKVQDKLGDKLKGLFQSK